MESRKSNWACPTFGGPGYTGLRCAMVLRTAPFGSTFTIPHALMNIKLNGYE